MYGIYYHISETVLFNQNPVKGIIREVRQKWYLNEVNRRVPRKLWDYSVSCTSATM